VLFVQKQLELLIVDTATAVQPSSIQLEVGEWGNNGHGGIPATSKSPTYLFFYGAVLRPVFSVIDMHIHDAVTLA